jgi:hypothetical protein
MGLINLIAGGIMDANKAIKQNKAQNNDSVQTVVVQNRFSIDVPSFLEPTTRFGEDASVQYWSRALDVSFNVVDEPKQEFVDAFKELKNELPDLGKGNTILDHMATMVLSNLFGDIDKVEIGNYQKTVINGLNAIMLNAFRKRTFLKDALYGSFAFVEGKDTLYQIIIISGGTSILKLADKLEQSICSFKEL